ncbi:MAG: CPBP family intramembrane metalloprotease [Candidatus Micrarchaeota archaeon]|nr:CPBP family intramembrane metalloprotease [Candidatus Micrarchaeota archaeon]
MKKSRAVWALLLLASAAFIYFLEKEWQPSAIFSLSFLLGGLYFSGNGNIWKALRFVGLFWPKSAKKVVFFSVAALVFCVSCAIFVSAVFSFFGILDSGKVAKKISELPAHILLFSFTAAPLSEEIFFRGFLFRALAKKFKGRYGVLLAALLSSALFSALHFSYGSLAQLAVAFLIGIGFCLISHFSGSLWPAVLAHSAFNFISVSIILLCKASGYCPF